MQGLLPNKPPFFYICNKCGHHFRLSKKFSSFFHPFLNGPKCPKCGSRDTEKNSFILK